MNTRHMITIMLIMFMLPISFAEWVQPLDCNKIIQGQVVPTEQLTEEEALCFYGTGYTPGSDVTVSLENEDNTLSKDVTVSQGGILTSLGNGIGSLIKGVYDLFVRGTGFSVRYPNKITVTGNDGGDGDDGDGGNSVPEFTTIAAGLALIGAGVIISRRRRD